MIILQAKHNIDILINSKDTININKCVFNEDNVSKKNKQLSISLMRFFNL